MKKLLPIIFTLIIFALKAQVPSGYSTIYSRNFETSLKAGEYLKNDVWYFYSGGPNVTSYSNPELDKRFMIKTDPKNSANKTIEMIKFQGDGDFNSSGLNPRTELSFRPSLERNCSKEIYFQLKTYFPSSQASVFSAEFIQFWVHGTTSSDTDIPLQIEVRNGNFGARLPRSPGFVTPFPGKSLSANLNRWITWEVKAKFNKNGGYWKIYMDDELVFTYSGPINYWPDNSGTWHPQFGAYANKSGTGTMDIYFDDFIIAEKTSSVVDCNGTPNGTAKLDACGVCSGGTTGITPSSPVNWYADADNDGKGDPSVVIQSCSQPAGYVADNSDLCPNDKNKTSPGNCGCGVAEGTCVNQNPIVSFTTPQNGTSLEAPADLYVKVNATDSDGTISKVLLYINNEFVRQENLSPYEWGAEGQNDPLLYNLPAGTYILKAVATDNDGATVSQTITITVNPVVSNTIGINGSSCIAAGGTYSYTVNPDASSSTYQWWSNSGATITQSTSDPKKISIQIPSYMNGTSFTLSCGVNFTASPWYKEYIKTIKVGGCAAKVSAVINPQPSEEDATLSMENGEKILSVIIFNSQGVKVFKESNIDADSYLFGADLAAGIYMIQIESDQGTTVTRFVKR